MSLDSVNRHGRSDRMIVVVHEPPRQLRVGVCFGVMLFAAEVAPVHRQQPAATHTPAVVVQVVVYQVRIVRAYVRVLVDLIFRAVALMVLVEYVVVGHKCVAGAETEPELQLDPLSCRRVAS